MIFFWGRRGVSRELFLGYQIKFFCFNDNGVLRRLYKFFVESCYIGYFILSYFRKFSVVEYRSQQVFWVDVSVRINFGVKKKWFYKLEMDMVILERK